MIRLERKDEMRMEVENDLAKALETISDENMEKLDASCKKLLSFKSVLSRLLKTCVDEFKDVSLKDIEEKYPPALLTLLELTHVFFDNKQF